MPRLATAGKAVTPSTGHPSSGHRLVQSAPAQRYSIGELSAEFSVTARAIRFYESKGLIAPERRGSSRAYTRRDRARLQMILRGKNLGFSLEEIREFLDLYDADPSMGVQTRHLLGKVERAITDLACKRADIDRSLQELAQIRAECLAHLDGKGVKSGKGADPGERAGDE